HPQLRKRDAPYLPQNLFTQRMVRYLYDRRVAIALRAVLTYCLASGRHFKDKLYALAAFGHRLSLRRADPGARGGRLRCGD
ncbi:MAG: hypothetical protein ACP5R5_12935, partial [Armatimonadota bacterium]